MPDIRNDETAERDKVQCAAPRDKNETMPEARDAELDFNPIKIKGDPLSATIIRERRERPW